MKNTYNCVHSYYTIESYTPKSLKNALDGAHPLFPFLSLETCLINLSSNTSFHTGKELDCDLLFAVGMNIIFLGNNIKFAITLIYSIQAIKTS